MDREIAQNRKSCCSLASAGLDAGVEASGPHDFAVREKHLSSVRFVIAHGPIRTRPAITSRAKRCRVHRIAPDPDDIRSKRHTHEALRRDDGLEISRADSTQSHPALERERPLWARRPVNPSARLASTCPMSRSAANQTMGHHIRSEN
jgi:hypothetical protein